MQQAHASSAPVLRLGCDPQVDAALCNAMQQQLESDVAGRFNVLQVRYGAETPTAPAEMGLALRIDRQGEGWVAAHLEWQAGRDGHSGRGPSVELSVMDAPATTATPYSISVGDVFTGSLSFVGDRDWVAVSFEAGQTYSISLGGAGSGVGTLDDPYLRLHDGSGAEIRFDDDGGAGLDSFLTFTATSSGTYYISAGAFSDGSVGTYEIALTQVEPAQNGSLEELADYLVNGFWQDRGGAGRSFDTSGSNQISVNLAGLTTEGRDLARWAMEAWEMIANIEFVEVSGTALITFDDEDSGAYNTSSTSGGRLLSSFINVSTAWLDDYGTTIDSYSFQTYVHEIGHALGLGHQGRYNGAATFGTDETFLNDSWQMSVMSYFNQNQNTTINASYARLLTPMMADILAIQTLYGASSATAGDTTWGANSNLGGYLGAVFAEIAGEGDMSGYAGTQPVAFTLSDEGGHDTFDLSTSTTGARIDMRPETFSDVGGLIGNVAIARGTIIEDLLTGSGNDTIMGNDAGNSITSGAGNDSVDGGAGNDSILGGTGNDTLIGGAGNDTLRGEDGADLIEGGASENRLWGGAGNDTIYGGANNDIMGGGADNDLMYAGAGDDSLYGGGGNDTIQGDSGFNVLWGGLGNDSITASNQGGRIGGGAGNDTLTGGNGADTIYGGAALGNDLINGGAGDDLSYGGNGNDTVSGGTGDDFIGGALGDDRIIAGPGDDTVRGGAGADTFVFGRNDDILIIEDFSLAENDRLELDDALWGGGLTTTQVLSEFGIVTGGNLVLDFGGGDIVTLNGITNTAGMASLIEIV